MDHHVSAAQVPGRAYFFQMPDDDELLRRSLDRSPEELRRMLMRVLFRLRADLAQAEEKNDQKTVELKRLQIQLCERSLSRVRRMTPAPR
jgi:hypothetical protein